MQRILAATDFSTRSQRALRRAGLLARQTGAELTLLHVVDEDQPAHLVDLERGEATKILSEQIGSVAELRGVRCHGLAIAGVAFKAIIESARSSAADLIVMGSHRKQLLLDIFIGTTIERVVRAGPIPVLMVNTEPARPYAKVVAAVDISEASAHALRSAKALGFLDNVELTVAHAFEAPAKSKLFIADVPKERVDAYVDQERLRVTAELDTFVQAHMGQGAWSSRLEEGEPRRVISDTVSKVYGDLVVIGTHGRSGLTKILLGSVAEQVLGALETDIVAIPPSAQ
jgi:nucleotide-binding universal stress UspA family protein